MKKKYLLGGFLLAIAVMFFGSLYIEFLKYDSKEHIENKINREILNWNDAVGAFYPIEEDKMILLRPASYFTNQDYCFRGGTTNWEKALTFHNTDYIIQEMNTDEYSFYSFMCTFPYERPHAIFVKKNSYGYDVTGEYILGIALTKSFPEYLVFPIERSEASRSISYMYDYVVFTDKIGRYYKYLKDDKYKDIPIYDEVSTDIYESADSCGEVSVNKKYDELNEFALQNYIDDAKYGNKYYSLKLDGRLTLNHGYKEIEDVIHVWGDERTKVFSQSVTLHYSIQKNEESINRLYINLFILMLTCELLYMLIILWYYRREH